MFDFENLPKIGLLPHHFSALLQQFALNFKKSSQWLWLAVKPNGLKWEAEVVYKVLKYPLRVNLFVCSIRMFTNLKYRHHGQRWLINY